MTKLLAKGLVLLAVVFLLFPAGVWAEKQPVGKIIAIIGSAEYLPGGEDSVAGGQPGQVVPVSLTPWQKVQPKQLVYASDEFRTGRKSRLRILFEDSSLMALGPNSRMTISSYLFDAKERLRQGVIAIGHGISMYIVNKDQKHPQSHFKILSPTANVAARGTQGYLSVSQLKTLVANQAGFIRALNADPLIFGDVMVGPMMKTVIEEGQPPTEPEALTGPERNLIQQVIMGWASSRYREKPRQGSIVTDALQEEYDLFEEDESDPCTSG
ncbi:MAG: FecR family protein [Nitrospinota bacterium]|nr:FecR family protein [Nitrospinota bacterium]